MDPKHEKDIFASLQQSKDALEFAYAKQLEKVILEQLRDMLYGVACLIMEKPSGDGINALRELIDDAFNEVGDKTARSKLSSLFSHRNEAKYSHTMTGMERVDTYIEAFNRFYRIAEKGNYINSEKNFAIDINVIAKKYPQPSNTDGIALALKDNNEVEKLNRILRDRLQKNKKLLRENKELESKLKENNEHLDSIEQSKKEKSIIDKQVARLIHDKETLEEVADRLTSKIKTNQGLIDEIKEEIERREVESGEINEEIARSRMERDTLDAEISEKTYAKTMLSAKLTELHRQTNSLRVLSENTNYIGYPKRWTNDKHNGEGYYCPCDYIRKGSGFLIRGAGLNRINQCNHHHKRELAVILGILQRNLLYQKSSFIRDWEDKNRTQVDGRTILRAEIFLLVLIKNNIIKGQMISLSLTNIDLEVLTLAVEDINWHLEAICSIAGTTYLPFYLDHNSTPLISATYHDAEGTRTAGSKSEIEIIDIGSTKEYTTSRILWRECEKKSVNMN